MPRKSKGIYKKIEDERMSRAVNAVKNEGMSTRKAAEAFGIPKSTLSDHLTGKVVIGRHSGRTTVFPPEVEKEMVEMAKSRASEGFGISRQQLVGKAARLATAMRLKTPFSGGKPGQAWWDGFRQRNPSITLRKPEKLASVRARNMNAVTLSNYFRDLSAIVHELNLKNSPQKIWNMDETGCQMEHKPISVIARKGSKSVPGVVGNSRESATILPCINAAGRALSPMVIVRGKTSKSLNGFNTDEGPTNAVWTFQAKAWIDEAGALKWLKDIFLKEIGPERPQLLILDQHISHEAVDFLEEAKSNEISIFALPPHTTHYLCPLDRCVFGPFKKYYNKVCSEFTSSSPGNIVIKWTWPSLLRQAYGLAFSADNIKQGFKSCGIFPMNPSAIPADAIAPSLPTDLNAPDDTRSIMESPLGVDPQSTIETAPGVAVDPVLEPVLLATPRHTVSSHYHEPSSPASVETLVDSAQGPVSPFTPHNSVTPSSVSVNVLVHPVPSPVSADILNDSVPSFPASMPCDVVTDPAPELMSTMSSCTTPSSKSLLSPETASLEITPFQLVSEVSEEEFSDLQLLSQIALGSEVSVDTVPPTIKLADSVGSSPTGLLDPLWSSTMEAATPNPDWNMELNNLFNFRNATSTSEVNTPVVVPLELPPRARVSANPCLTFAETYFVH